MHENSFSAGDLRLSRRVQRRRRLAEWLGESALFCVTAVSAISVLFIFYFVARDAIPFFQLRGFREFFTSTHWYPSREPPAFGALAIFFGSALVTVGAVAVAVPLGLIGAVALSEILPFGWRQLIKPVVEMLAALPSVAYGFFALVVLAPLFQELGGRLLAWGLWLIGFPTLGLVARVAGDLISSRRGSVGSVAQRWLWTAAVATPLFWLLIRAGQRLSTIAIASGTNALTASLVLGVMALPTIVSVSEDALQSVARDLRMASYALGATRAETVWRVVIPAAAPGLIAAVILGVMRAMGETMVVWMASGNAAQIPRPWFNFLEPVRTLTATIAGDMGEADHVTGSARFHVLFAMALCLLIFSFLCNMATEWIASRTRARVRP